MPRVRFLRRFHYHIPERNGLVTQSFKQGYVGLVTTPCAEAAVKAGAAEYTRPRKMAAPSPDEAEFPARLEDAAETLD